MPMNRQDCPWLDGVKHSLGGVVITVAKVIVLSEVRGGFSFDGEGIKKGGYEEN